MNKSLPIMAANRRSRALFWGAAGFVVAYLLLGESPLGNASYLRLTVFDEAIPLLPWTLLFYLSDYVFVLLALLSLKKDEDFSRAYYRMIAGAVISFAVFLLFPTTYPRPLVPVDSAWSVIYSYLHFVDRPTNCFPSLHVSITLIAAVSLAPLRPWWRRGGYAWAALICLSTLTTKQHYIVDLLGGVFVTFICVRLISTRSNG